MLRRGLFSLLLIASFSSSSLLARDYFQRVQTLAEYEYAFKTNEGIKSDLFDMISHRHKTLSYKQARKYLIGKLHLKRDFNGYYVRDVYCLKSVTNGTGPMQIPHQEIINTEHTWPRSRFSRKFSKSLQKSDLHHLFPSDPVANSTRGNSLFGEVRGQLVSNCYYSYHGKDMNSRRRFEPPRGHKGNVARALFYFSIRYQIPISSTEELQLRQWHELDPVDSEELERNSGIERIQGNRNPFIDSPELVKRIGDF